jgi:hypothetical protein
MKHIKLFMATLTLVLSLGGGVLMPSMAAAVGTPAKPNPNSPQSTVCSTLGSNATCTTTPAGSVSLDNTITAVVNILSIIIGVLAVLMIMVQGFRMITANGDSNTISNARSGILYSIAGLLVALFAQVIVQYVTHRFHN